MKEELGSNLVYNLEHWSIADELLLFLVIIMRQTCDDVGGGVYGWIHFFFLAALPTVGCDPADLVSRSR